MQRTPEEIRQHYVVEKELADRLRRADRKDRLELYGKAYDELFRRVPRHPQLTRKVDQRERTAAVAERLALLKRFLHPDSVFLEIGAGDCSLSRSVAESVKKCLALDVSREILDMAGDSKMEVILSDGCSIPVPEGSVSVAYSYQLIEHIHPDDAIEQLQNIYRALEKGGVYLCVTPNRLNGPHDVSRYFDRIASGFHLKEYTVSELASLFRNAGFRRTSAYVGLSHHYFRLPVPMLVMLEKMLEWMPFKMRHGLGNLWGVRNLLFISIAAEK